MKNMYLESVNIISKAAKVKIEYLKRSILSYMTSSVLAGTYIGIGIVLAFSVGGTIGG